MPSSNAPGRLLFAVLLCFLATPCFAQEFTAFTGRVTSVSDGDVITVVDGNKKEHKVRLAGIDAPEAGQEFGPAARKYLSDLTLDQTVTVVGRRSDDGGRLVAQVFLLGRDISFSMLWAGFAWHVEEDKKDQPKEDRKRYAEGEKFARGTRDNIWSLSKPVPPWEFRKDHPAPKDSEKTLVLTPVNQPIKPPATITLTPALQIAGNKNSKIYHWNPGCPDFSKIAEKNRVTFRSKAEAEAAGYRAAKNCKAAESERQ